MKMGKGMFTKINKTQGFLTLGHLNYTICIVNLLLLKIKFTLPTCCRSSLGRIIAKDRREPDEPPVLVLYHLRVLVLFPIRYSIGAAQQDSALKMTHI